MCLLASFLISNIFKFLRSYIIHKIGIHPALNADVLYALASAGHGDVIVVVDKNFPAETVAKQSVLGRVVRMENLTAPEAMRALLTVLPLDTFVPQPVARMEVVGDATKVLPIAQQVQHEVNVAFRRQTAGTTDSPLASVERFEFYERAKKAFCVIVTGEVCGVLRCAEQSFINFTNIIINTYTASILWLFLNNKRRDSSSEGMNYIFFFKRLNYFFSLSLFLSFFLSFSR